MSEVILYDYWRSSASYRVRIALNLAEFPTYQSLLIFSKRITNQQPISNVIRKASFQHF